MKVRATAVGFLDCIREVGDEFEVTDEQFSEKWMEESEDKPRRGRPPKAKEPEEPEDS